MKPDKKGTRSPVASCSILKDTYTKRIEIFRVFWPIVSEILTINDENQCCKFTIACFFANFRVFFQCFIITHKILNSVAWELKSCNPELVFSRSFSTFIENPTVPQVSTVNPVPNLCIILIFFYFPRLQKMLCCNQPSIYNRCQSVPN